MRDIIISIRNDFVAEAIIHSLKKVGDFQTFKLLFSRDDEVIRECEAVQPEILLSEVAFGKATDLRTRLAEAKAVRANTPNCKIVFLCDENSAPDLAREVMQAKKDGLIDNFFYSSVGSRYLVAALSAL